MFFPCCMECSRILLRNASFTSQFRATAHIFVVVYTEREFYGFSGIERLFHIRQFAPRNSTFGNAGAAFVGNGQFAVFQRTIERRFGLTWIKMFFRDSRNQQSSDFGSSAILWRHLIECVFVIGTLVTHITWHGSFGCCAITVFTHGNYVKCNLYIDIARKFVNQVASVPKFIAGYRR